jgi:hypothetical protein
MIRVIKFFKSSSRERSVLLRSLVWVTLYRTGLSALPFSVTKKWTVDTSTQASKPYDEKVVTEIVRGVRFASRFVPYATCLTQALAARKLLGDAGQFAELKIGVAKSTGDFEAHAWLEIDGRIVLGKQSRHSRYVVLGSSAAIPKGVR